MSNVIIIGSGPAGISAALYTARAGLETTILTKGSGALGKAEKIQNYYGFAEPITGAALEQAGIEGAKSVGVQFVEAEVVGLGFEDKLTVHTDAGSYAADGVILATGSPRAVPKIAGVVEFEGKGISYCAVCDAFFYRGKHVAVLGSGEYALHEVAALLPLAASVTLVTNGASLTAQFPPEVPVVETKVLAVGGLEHVEQILLADDTKLDVDGIFVAYGTAGSADLARKIGAQTEGNRILVDSTMATNVPGLYAAGDCTGGLLQVAKAVYEGALAGTEVVKLLRKR